jgi:enoyl-CoA hydratase
MPTTVRVETAGPITTVVLDRPEVRNAVDEPTAQQLREAFLAFERDPRAAVAVLWGAGGAFCAGADLRYLAETAPGGAAGQDPRTVDPEHAARAAPGEADWTERLCVTPPGDDLPPGPMGPTRLALSKPVIAAVAGPAVAGGMELALWCDIRVLEASAYFGVYCRRWGVPLIDGGTVRLPRLVGLGRAMEIILTGRQVTAAEALAIGLCERVVADGAARAAAEELAHEIARFPRACTLADRASALGQQGLPQREALRQELAGGLAALRAEGIAGARRFASGKGRHGSFVDV